MVSLNCLVYSEDGQKDRERVKTKMKKPLGIRIRNLSLAGMPASVRAHLYWGPDGLQIFI